MTRRALDAFAGKRRGAHISFASAEFLWKVLTAKRWELIKAYLATGAGPVGRCCDYLFETTRHLRQLGLRDRRLEALEAKVRALGAER